MQTITFALPGSDDLILSEVLFRNPLEENGSGGDLIVKVVNGDLKGRWFILQSLEGVPISEFEDGFWELLNELFPECDSLEESPKVNVRDSYKRFNKFSLSSRKIAPLSLPEKEELVKKFFGDYSPEMDIDELVLKIKMVVQDIYICFPEVEEVNYEIVKGLKSLLSGIDHIDEYPEVEEILDVRCEGWLVEKILYRNELVRGGL